MRTHARVLARSIGEHSARESAREIPDLGRSTNHEDAHRVDVVMHAII